MATVAAAAPAVGRGRAYAICRSSCCLGLPCTAQYCIVCACVREGGRAYTRVRACMFECDCECARVWTCLNAATSISDVMGSMDFLLLPFGGIALCRGPSDASRWSMSPPKKISSRTTRITVLSRNPDHKSGWHARCTLPTTEEQQPQQARATNWPYALYKNSTQPTTGHLLAANGCCRFGS